MSLLSSIVDLVKRAFTGESERKPEVRPSRTVIQETPWPRVVRTPGTTVSPYPYGDVPRAREKVDAPKPKPVDLKKDPLHKRIMHYWMLLEMAKEIDMPRDSYEKFFEGNALRMKYGKKNIDAFFYRFGQGNGKENRRLFKRCGLCSRRQYAEGFKRYTPSRAVHYGHYGRLLGRA